MGRVLTAGVAVRPPGGGNPVFLPSGSEVPEWATELVGEHVLEPTDDNGDNDADPPPQSGPGSLRSRWLEYASQHNVPVRDDATREDIIAACQAAGVRTE